ncbi:MAG: N-acetyl-alpha-D-glucosaminyl L-malate synthase BshA [Bryobacterales bacterium]|nr:N-acetyl-alpha-D-glucosaminyl L-malate synthase BshA [Bryobacterales bacterium]
MRIGITCYPTYGGSGIVATELGLELAQRGHEVHFITYANPIRLDTSLDRIHYHEVEVATYPLFQYPPYTLALASRMAEVAERYSLDILHVHYAIPHSISAYLARGILASRGIHIPIATTLHGTDITLVGTDRSYFLITKFAIEQSDGVTAVSRNLCERMKEVFSIEKPVRVIYNSVNLDLYKPRPHQNAEPLLVHVSNFRPVKRVLDCVRVLAALRQRMPARLKMVGDGPDRGPAERLAQELGVADFVEFPGKCGNIAATIAEADLLLLPSELEAFGLVALEAMASGVPVVATDVGGIPEVVSHGVDGFLCAVGDVDAMAARSHDLLTDAGLRERFVAAARHTAESRFSTDAIIPQYEAFYESLIRAGSGSLA